MKRILSFLLCLVLTVSFFAFDTRALEEASSEPYVIDFVVTSDSSIVEATTEDTRAAGLILMYSLSLSKTGTTLKITGLTYGNTDVVKSGFKNLIVERKKANASDWEEYYDFGNIYVDDSLANLSTTLAVTSGYQYRVTCKHYAKKSLLVTQTISNTSNTVAV